MRGFEFAKMPFQLGIQPIKWVGGLVVNQATEAARANVLAVWRRPWEAEAHEHLDDAKQQRDYVRADEQRSLLECIDHYAPHTAEEFEELRVVAAEKPPESQLDEVLGPTATPRPDD